MLVYEAPVALGRAQQPEAARAWHRFVAHACYGIPIHRGQPALEIPDGITDIGDPVDHLAQRVLGVPTL